LRIKTKRDADKVCKKLQKILRLQDWDVNVQFVHPAEIKGTVAQVSYVADIKYATISLIDPQFDDRELLSDLIHELLHLHFCTFFDIEGLKGKLMEQAIVSLERAFFELLKEAK